MGVNDFEFIESFSSECTVKQIKGLAVLVVFPDRAW